MLELCQDYGRIMLYKEIGYKNTLGVEKYVLISGINHPVECEPFSRRWFLYPGCLLSGVLITDIHCMIPLTGQLIIQWNIKTPLGVGKYVLITGINYTVDKRTFF